MGRYVINLSWRADVMTQEIILPMTFSGFSQCGVPHGEIRSTATHAPLQRPTAPMAGATEKDRIRSRRKRYSFS